MSPIELGLINDLEIVIQKAKDLAAAYDALEQYKAEFYKAFLPFHDGTDYTEDADKVLTETQKAEFLAVYNLLKQSDN